MSAVKALQQWCKLQVSGYRDVAVTNMTTSFRDGLAFCALIHKHRPDLINFDSLKKDDVYENNKLAFQVAQEKLGIPALLDAEDMVALKIPDRLSVITYVSQYYNYFHGRSPIGGMAGIKRPADGSAEEPSGKKNQPVVSKAYPSSTPATENRPPSSNLVINPTPSPARPSTTAASATSQVLHERSNRTGTLSNKCASCDKHVHLVQRHLVDGKLYHRNCAKSVFPESTPLRDVARNAPQSVPLKTNIANPTPAPSKLGPTWLSGKTEKSSPQATTSGNLPTSSPWRPASALSSAGTGNRANSASTTAYPVPASRTTHDPTTTHTTTVTITPRPSASPRSSLIPTSTISTTPTPAPRTSVASTKTHQAKLKFFHTGPDNSAAEDQDKKKTSTLNRWLNVDSGQGQGLRTGQDVRVVVSTAGLDDHGGSRNEAKAAGPSGASGKLWSKEENTSNSNSKSQAAAFLSKKLTEENNNTKPTWTNKKTDKSSPAQPPKNETAGVGGKKRLKADPSLLADLDVPYTPSPAAGLASRSGLGGKTGSPKPPNKASPNTTASSESSGAPAEWRSKLKPISKENKLDSPSKPWGPKSGPLPSAAGTPDSQQGTRGFLNGAAGGNNTKTETKSSKHKPDYIPKEKILKELQEIEDNLNELEKRGVDLEKRLRDSEEEGEEDSDALMVEWFTLIRNKQQAMRRESELVYIAKNQDLEEHQPTVEQELRRLMDKPEHLKTSWDRRREDELMKKLFEIVDDRNAIIDNLDEDRLREEEEDEQLNKMMQTFDLKKDKPKKKSPFKLFTSWGNKKEG